jgi:hypothetical protein
MQKISIYIAKINCLGILYISLIFFASSAIATTLKADNWLDEPISISFQNETLSKVLKQISEQTGVSIAYDQKLATEKVTGAYQGVKTSDAITRLFKSKNISIQVNTEKKVIIVKTFGAKSFIWAGTVQGNDGFAKMTLAELETVHTQQYKEYKEQIADANEILDIGMTRGELTVLHKNQYKEYQTRRTEDNVILNTKMTRSEMHVMNKKQYSDYQKALKNDSIVLDTGMTRGEMQIMNKKQYSSYQTALKNDSIVLDTGMTRGEMRVMQSAQYIEYKNKIKP